jgi:hypothetical protein
VKALPREHAHGCIQQVPSSVDRPLGQRPAA